MKFSFLKTGERLRNKIFLGVALVALIPFVLSGLFALYVMNSSHNDDISKIERNLLSEKRVETQKYVSDSLSELELNLPFSLPSGFVRYLQSNEQFGNASLVRTLQNGKRIVFSINPPSQLDDLLASALAQNKAFNELYFVDAQTGLEVAYASNYPTNHETVNEFADFSNLPQVKSAKDGSDYVGSVNFTLAGPVMDIAAPVKDQDGRVIGILAGELSLSGLKRVFAGTMLGNSGYAYLLDDDGNLLYNSDAGKSATTAKDFSASSFLQRVTQEARMGKSRYQSLWGDNVVAAAAPITLKNAADTWMLAAEWPVQDADQAIATIQRQFIFFLIAVILLTIFFSIFFANRITKPINILEIGTERIASGIFDSPVKIETNDELEDLGMAFNKMMAGLKQLQELKDEFVFIAAHELRTPVAAIKGYLSMIMDGSVGKVDDTAKEFIKKVMNANQRLIQLVNDLLQVARSEAGKLTIQVAAMDVVEPITSTLDELKPLASEKSIAMNYASSAAPKVMTDPVRLKEVLVNLVGNAIKYSGNGGSVTITHEIKDKNLVISVKDTGFGIGKEAQAKLFEKFYRVQTDKTREITGTGLGLFIVKQIVEKMNGKISVKSTEGQGSTFSFSLPLA